MSLQMFEGKGRFIQDTISFNLKIREQMARPNRTKFKKPVSWYNGKKVDKLSRLPQDCLLHIFTYLDWQDLESMKSVSQTMHSLANFTINTLNASRTVDVLCISQYCIGWGTGDVFELYSRDCSQQRYMYYLEAAKVEREGHSAEQRMYAKDKKLMHVSELFEFRHIYKGAEQYSMLFEHHSLPSPFITCPAALFFTRLEHAIRRTSFAELRLVNVLLASDYLRQIGRALEGKTPQTIHFKRIKNFKLNLA
ncbi:hypothetical protein PFISCL1PPCAC_18220 [Pristionchus fissidentatus]|uniref:F-box domain-containing protein n=1 Tax=Pristionchus fissidentatus TaxID=1538716 RepID=A0AAV5W933_9BILA|nr:hypothetical protein PFISCL1PPCAC_18220 [Pristionchus fissidentatus]